MTRKRNYPNSSSSSSVKTVGPAWRIADERARGVRWSFGRRRVECTSPIGLPMHGEQLVPVVSSHEQKRHTCSRVRRCTARHSRFSKTPTSPTAAEAHPVANADTASGKRRRAESASPRRQCAWHPSIDRASSVIDRPDDSGVRTSRRMCREGHRQNLEVYQTD